MASNITLYKRFLNNCISGNVEIVKSLIENDLVDPSEQNNYAIIIASRDNKLEIIKQLLKDDRVDASDNNNKAIRLAFKNEHYEIVKLLFNIEKVYRKLSKYQNHVWRRINEHISE